MVPSCAIATPNGSEKRDCDAFPSRTPATPSPASVTTIAGQPGSSARCRGGRPQVHSAAAVAAAATMRAAIQIARRLFNTRRPRVPQ